MQEIWKDIEGFENCYQVSNLGNVKSLNRNIQQGNRVVKLKGRLLKFNKVGNTYKTNPYLAVSLGKKNPKLVHILVALHFVENPDNLDQINHKNLNKSDNFYENLEWSTQLENIIHYKNAGIIPNKPNRKIVFDLRSGIFYSSIFEASVAKNLNYNTLMCKLSGFTKNNTDLIHA